MTKEIPTHWVEAMEKVGAVDPRNGKASMRRLAEMSNTSTSTISYMIHGGRRTDAANVATVAESLRLPLSTVYEWLGIEGVEARGGFEWPKEADQLSLRQRKAVRELIFSMVDPKGESRARPMTTSKNNPFQADHDLAADKGENLGRAKRERMNGLGEESQEEGIL